MPGVATDINKSNTDVHDDALRQLVCFKLGNEDFGVDISKVQEINRMVDITHIPQSPPFVEGVINLRGQIIPVVDLRLRFGLETAKERNKENRIVVIETVSAIVGFIVDEVTEVLRIKSSSIESTPEMVTTGVEIRYIEGVAMLEDSLLIVLNTDLIFSKEEHESMASMND